MLKYILVALLAGQQVLGQDHTFPQLNGVGLVQSQDTKNGVWGLSIAGGAELFIYGQKLSMTPSKNIVQFTLEGTTTPITVPPLSNDNEFKSNTGLGKLQYTTPSLAALFSQPMENLSSVDGMRFFIGAQGLDSTGTIYNNLQCPNKYDCSIYVHRLYTPVFYYLSPPVVYHTSITALSVDPKWSLDKQRSGDWPFTEARIDNHTIDFQNTVSGDTLLSAMVKNQVLGMVGDQPPSNSSTINVKFAAGYSIFAPNTNVHCNYDNSKCYNVKTVPKIDSISAQSGYTSGGQPLTIYGYGLNGDNVDVKVDGVPCQVQSKSRTQVTCITGPKSAQSTNNTDTIGQQGLRRRIYNNTAQTNFYLSQVTSYPYTEVLAMHLESAQDNATYYGNVFSGWFKAPATANYKFYMACDDGCELRMGSANMSSANPTLILSNTQALGFRNYWDLDGKLNTTWMPLVKDTYYYIEAKHIQGTGPEHVSVAVEIDGAPANHPNSKREIQRLQISPTMLRDLISITMTNPDSGSYNLQLLNPGATTYTTVTITCSASANDVKNALQGFFSFYYGAYISVTKTMTDKNGADTTTAAQSVKSVWLISVNKALSSVSITRMLAQPQVTNSTIQILLPAALQIGSPPISGKFIIQCFKSDGTSNYTIELAANTIIWQITNAIYDACTEYRDSLDIWEGLAYSRSYADGRDIFVKFTGANFDVPQFKITSGSTSPLIANNPQFNSLTTTPYGGSIFYEPIPFELLYTNETLPQVIVTVDTLPAVCAGLSCQYSYVNTPSQITSFSLSASQLTIIGTSLPQALQSITYSNAVCNVNSKSDTQIICTISPSFVSGQWIPQVKDAFGLVPVVAATQTLAVTVSSISPSTGLNPSGKTTLTISGSNFPQSTTDGNSISIKFSDQTICDVQSSISTQIQCLTRIFPSASKGQTLSVSVNVNGQTNSAQSVTVSSSQSSITGITPNTASPVLKAVLAIQVEATYAQTLSVSDLSVRIISTTDPTQFKQANVIDVDNTNKKIMIKFGGAPSGTYSLEVTSATSGLFNTAGVILTTLGAITAYSPAVGSVYGGQLITITGQVFSDSSLDNEVIIGGVDCDVISSSANQIKCRTGVRATSEATSDQIIISLKASEEAKCQAGDCKYQWTTANVPTLDSFLAQFDPTLKQHTISFSGSGFNGDTTTVQVYIDGILQTVTSVTSTSVLATIISLNGYSSTNVDIYFPIGSPAGYQNLAKGITLTPTLVSLSPNVGSPAGSLIIATVSGLGLGTTSTINLLTSSGATLCSSVTILSYSQVQCKTIAATYSSATTIKLQVGSSTQPCVNSDATKCQYSTGSTFPSVSSAVVSADYTRIEFTGTNFFTTGYTASAVYQGVQADSVTVTSGTAAYASYSLGVPATTAAVVPILYFTNTATQEAHWATNLPALTNTYIASNTASTVSCSFGGGCLLYVSGRGLATNLKNSQISNITVCGQLCTLSQADSTTSLAACIIPSISTQYSVNNFNISLSGDITKLGTTFSSNQLYTYTLFDGSAMNGWPSNTANCFIGVSYPSTYVGILSQVKFYMNAFTPTNYINNLIFQGSADGVTYTNILKIGQEIHTGWNYYDFKQDGTQPIYRYYRVFGSVAGSCVIGELVLTGQVAVADNNANFGCTPKLSLNGATSSLTALASYQGTLTPLLNSISPRFGTVKGGNSITFTGTGFSSDFTKYTILIDSIACVATAATSVSVTCTSGKRPGLFPQSTLSITISGQGSVSTQGLTYLYANLWSDTTTWGGEYQPVEGESVHIPAGLNLLVDVDSTPVLNAVLVEGSLIFPPDDANPSHQRTFDAHYVFVDGGYLEVGTEQFPYTSKLTITMYGNKQSPEIPIYGNKVIGVRNGILDLHGVVRSPTWTVLSTTANPGDATIKLNTAVDWVAGEQIVIASTSLNPYEAEQVTIVSVDNSNINQPVVTITPALLYKHYSAVETYGSQSITMRAEVGLLTRNVVFRGDPQTSSNNQFGAHIMLHSMGDESLIGRIENIECYDVGQAFQLGRYPLHFHMIGTVHQSYIKGNSIHQTYNRAVTFHGVHYLRVIQNVAFNVMGHTFFVEDAIETNNFIDSNLIIQTKRSWSLLNTDQTPACFWITNPYNILRNNHAAGSDRFGFWYDLKPNPTGPSYDPTICPDHMPLGQFKDNVAHSTGEYGLWIFHKHIPSTYPCKATSYDATNTTDPYWQNPPVTALIEGFTAYSTREVGLMFEEIGDVRIINAKTADHLVAGIEISMVTNVKNGKGQVNGALIIGNSQNALQEILVSKCWGLITSRSDHLSVNQVSFYKFDMPGMAALGSCSHCFHPAATDSGARTVTFSQLSFDSATVPRKINYQLPWRDIYFDVDGSLTGIGPNTWATNYNWEHNNQPECTLKMVEYNGYVCDSSIEIRRIAFWNYKPDTFRGMQMSVLKYDDSSVSAMDNATLHTYLDNPLSYSVVPFKPKKDPVNGWAVPFVTKHKYKVHWGYGIDFNQMQCDISDQWIPADHDLNLVFNFTEARARVNITTANDIIPNTTLTSKLNANLQSGDNIIYNDTAVRMINLVINGKNASRNSLFMTGERCAGSCFGDIADMNTENGTRYWSNTTSWPKGVLPIEGEDVVIDPSWNMILDLSITPVLSSLQINGVLTFKPSMNITLQAKIIFVRGGILNVGSALVPYDGIATILLYGEQSSQTVVYSDNIDTGNKMLANTGRVNMYGQLRKSQVTRLLQTANIGDQQIKVEKGLDWTVNDQIAIAANTMNYLASDSVKIVSYDPSTGIAVIDQKLSFYHWGDATSTGSIYNGVDTRAEVVLLTRNVIIRGTNTQGWGCQFLTSDFVEADGRPRYGRTFLDNVEIRNCSQFDNGKGAIRFQGAKGGYSLISNSAIHHGLGWAFNIDTSANVILKNNVFYSFIQFGGLIQSSSNLTIDSNVILHVERRHLFALDEFVDKSAGICVCSYNKGEICKNVVVQNNIVGGTFFYGYTAPGHVCGDYSDSTFKNNVAHSVQGNGVYIYADPARPSSGQCLEGSFFTAYKCTQDGAVTFDITQQAIFSYMTLIDNGFSAVVNIGLEADSLISNFKHSIVFGETAALDCPVQNWCDQNQDDICTDKIGFIVPYFQQAPKDMFPTMKSSLPVHKIKTYASWGGYSLIQNLTFSNFRSSKTYCGQSQSVFGYGEEYADYIPPSYYSGITLINVDNSALVFLYSPPSVWAVVDDCGEFPCTAPSNGLMSFENVRYKGDVTPDYTGLTFQIVANNPNAARAFKTCTFNKDWNAYQCQNDNLGLLLFESLDDDKEKRTFSPMVITSVTDNYMNTLNEFMDHVWDSFYTGQLRLARFPGVIQTGSSANTAQSKIYNISYTGTPPGSQRFKLIAQNGAITVSIRYPKAGTYSVSDVNGNLIPQNLWDDKISAPSIIKGKSCGENRFTGIVNILEFYLTPGCVLKINPVNSIQGRIRLAWTVEAFYSSGSSSFVDRFASVLNIPASSIKIVSVYTGSVQIIYTITDVTNNAVANLQALQTKIATLISGSTLGSKLGAPILDGDFGDTNTFVKPVTIIDSNTDTTKDTTKANGTNNGGSSNVTSGNNGNNGGQSSSSSSSNKSGNSGLSSSAKAAIIGSLVVLFVIIAILVLVWVVRKHRADRSGSQIKQSDFVSSDSGQRPDNEDEIYEPQYHPKTELGNIFGAGYNLDVAKNKANKADSVIGDEEQSPDKLVNETDEGEDVLNHPRTEQSIMARSHMENDQSHIDMMANLSKTSPDILRQKKPVQNDNN